jgi:predicted ATPase
MPGRAPTDPLIVVIGATGTGKSQVRPFSQHL